MRSEKTGKLPPKSADQATERRARWLRNPIAFIEEVLVNPETGKPFELYPVQRRFLREALTLTPGGALPFPEMVYSCPKKSGKTATTAMAMIYVIAVLGGPYAEGYCVANDMEQSRGRVFQQVCRVIEASPLLRNSATVTQNRITFASTGSTITAIASDAAGAAGSNPTLITFDELWGYVSEGSRRLWDEMIPVPTRKVSARWTSTYAGFEGESTLLEDLYKRGMKGRQIAPALYRQRGMLMLWSHKPVAPWQSRAWLTQMREQHRANAYLRQIENRWVSTESSFVEMEWYDACVDPNARPVVASEALPVFVGVDASTKRDSTAIAVTTFDNDLKKVRLIAHKIFTPSKAEPINFEATVEKTLLDLRRRFRVRSVFFDPFQMAATSQRLTRMGLPMHEFPQTVANLTSASTNLYELIKGGNLVCYSDDQIRTAVQKAVAVETPRGWKISKEKASARIDIVVALAQACLAAVEGQSSEPGFLGFLKREAARRDVAAGVPVEQAAIAAGLGAQELATWVERNAGAPSRLAAMSARPPADQIEVFEAGAKLMSNGVPDEEAARRVGIAPDALRAYWQRANTPVGGPSRPRYAPPGAAKVF